MAACVLSRFSMTGRGSAPIAFVSCGIATARKTIKGVAFSLAKRRKNRLRRPSLTWPIARNVRTTSTHTPESANGWEHFGFSHLITDKVRGLMEEYRKMAQANLAKAARERLERAEREAAEARAALEKAVM